MQIKPYLFTSIIHTYYEISDERAAEAIATGLKEIRKRRGYTLKEVEKETEIPNPTISRYENKENIPSIVQTLKLCTFYDITIDEILLAGLMGEEDRNDFFDELEKSEKENQEAFARLKAKHDAIKMNDFFSYSVSKVGNRV